MRTFPLIKPPTVSLEVSSTLPATQLKITPPYSLVTNSSYQRIPGAGSAGVLACFARIQPHRGNYFSRWIDAYQQAGTLAADAPSTDDNSYSVWYTGGPHMRYAEIQPRPPLSRFVECFWTLQGETNLTSTTAERILPDGCVELTLNYGDRFSQHDGQTKSLQPQNFLVGQMTGPIFISPTGVVDLLGVRFHPGGTAPFLRTAMYEFTDQVIEFDSIAPTLHRGLLEVSEPLQEMSERVAAIEALLLQYLSRCKQESWLLPLAAKVVASGGLVAVDDLANMAGISSRQLERRFLQEVGVGPKLLSRILRFQQVFRAVERCDGGWAPVALECGYYDQAHLIRDFNQFALQTPSVLFAEQTELTQSFTRKTRTSHFSNTQR